MNYADDPRTCQPEKTSLAGTLLDLDETERTRATSIARKLERAFRRSQRFDENLLPTLWNIAHDQAIADVADARAKALLNGDGTWHEGTWGGRRGGSQPKA